MFGFDKTDFRMMYNFFKINLKDKYLSSKLGSLWAIINPIMMLSIFTFIFGFVYKARFPGATTTLSYVIWLVSGYGPWLALSEGILGTSGSIISNTGIVKNIAFKIEVLPIAAALVSIVPLLVSLLFLFVIMLLDGQPLSWIAFFTIPVILLMYLFMIGLGFFLSAVTVFLRDLLIVLPNILMMILFVSPIFYTLSSMPKIIQLASKLNPFYILTDAFRQALVYHLISRELCYELLYVLCLSILLFFWGLKRFRSVRGYFASVM